MNFVNARLLLQQHCFGTLAHELGNITSPVALVADALETMDARHASSVAGTLRLVTTSLARATTICRILRGRSESSAMAPATIADARAWWLLCHPLAEALLPSHAQIDATVEPIVLDAMQYEALVWATLATCRFASETRPALERVTITGQPGRNATTFVVRMTATAPREAIVPTSVRQLLQLASWEVRRVGGRMLVSDAATALECRFTLPLPATA